MTCVRSTNSPRRLAILTITRGRTRSVSLGELGDTGAVPALTETITPPSLAMRAASVETLAKLGGDRAVPALIGSLDDSDGSIREASAEALGTLVAPRAVLRLIAALEDPETRVRLAATKSLLQFELDEHREEIVALLLDLLRDRGVFDEAEAKDLIRVEADRVLGKLGDRQAVPALLEALEDEYRQEVVLSAMRALGDIGDPEAAPALIGIVNERFKRIGLTATRVLGRLGDPRAGDLLIDVLYRSRHSGISNADEVVKAAAESLGNLGIVRAIPHLLAQLHRTEYTVAVTVVGALKQLGDTLAMRVLIEMLESPDSYLDDRTRVARVLRALEDRAAVPPFIRDLGDVSLVCAGQPPARWEDWRLRRRFSPSSPGRSTRAWAGGLPHWRPWER